MKEKINVELRGYVSEKIITDQWFMKLIYKDELKIEGLYGRWYEPDRKYYITFYGTFKDGDSLWFKISFDENDVVNFGTYLLMLRKVELSLRDWENEGDKDA